MARLGLTVHLDTPIVDAGFNGVLTIEMFNAGPSDVILRPGMPVAKVILYRVGGDPASVEYLVSLGLNYLSCSPRRIPLARFSAGRATLMRSTVLPD